MRDVLGVANEVGRLRTVLLHRPGPELRRLTPRNNVKLLFDGIPWVGRAQEEHDAFAEALRGRGVRVLYLTDLLGDVLQREDARTAAIADTVNDPRLGDQLRAALRGYLGDLHPEDLARTFVAGLARDELKGAAGLAYRLMGRHDFVVDPLPNLLFTRDSSVWVADRVAVASLATSARRRETSLLRTIYAFHPLFADTTLLYTPDLEHVEGGDVLLLGAGVLAVGIGERTTPAGAERLARQAFARGVARAVLAVPIAQRRATMHLDTLCTMVDVDAVLMYPAAAEGLHAYTITPDGGGLRVRGPTPFLDAAAAALGLERVRVIDTSLDPITAEREQWDDGNNTLALCPRLAVAYERNVETNARLEQAGVEVVRIRGSELATGRGGPRCMSCPIRRDPT